MSFYRIYRPQIIEDLDTESVKKQLLAFARKSLSELPHAYLFSGPRGTGKTTTARILAKLFNCTKKSDKGPCGSCDQCQAIALGSHLDVIEIDAASNRGVDEIRLLRDRIGLAPAFGKYTVYIIDEVHMLTTEAFNALLKTLEEPPSHAIFILATTDPQKVPVTIKSRCTSILFARAKQASLAEGLARIIRHEKLDVSQEVIGLIVDSADGSFRDAVKLLEQVSLMSAPYSLSDARQLLSASDPSSVDKFILALGDKNIQNLLMLTEALATEGRDLRQFMIDLVRRLLDLAKTAARGDQTPIALIDLQYMLKRSIEAFGQFKITPIAELPLELAIIDYCTRTSAPLSKPYVTQKLSDIKETSKEIPRESIHQKNVDAALVSSQSLGASGLITLERLTECWKDVIDELKPQNHSVAGVLRSTRPKAVQDGIVTIEAFYSFHQERLSELATKDMLSAALKKLFGEKVKVDIVLGKK